MSDILPPTSELFDAHTLVERHPTILTTSRVKWALRNRATNGLGEQNAVYESQAGLLIHEPTFIRWFLGLSGRAKPRAARKQPVSDGVTTLVTCR